MENLKIDLTYEEVTKELSIQIGSLQTSLTIERIKNRKLQEEILKREEEINTLKQDAKRE